MPLNKETKPNQTKTIEWMASTCSSVVKVFVWPDWRWSLLSLPCLKSYSPLLHSCIGMRVLRNYLYHLHMDFFECHTFLFYECSGLFCPFLDLSHIFQLYMGFSSTDIKTEIWISFFQQKYSSMPLLSMWGLELFKWP